MKKKYEFLDLATVDAPYISDIEEAVSRVIRSGRYIGGAECDALEARLASLTGSTFAIGVSNGLDALRLILHAYVRLGVMAPGDEIIVPANTYIASVLAISDAGLTPVLVEPDPLTSNLDTAAVLRAIGPRTRGVMPVHLYGRVCWDENLLAMARDMNLKIIEDNAQAIGARSPIAGIDGKSHTTGALGHAAAFSFYPTKNIGAIGDAGAVTTSDPDLAAAVRALANYGSDRRYHNIYRGFNCRLDPIQAAIIGVKLDHLEAESRRRREVADVYLSEITNPAIILPPRGGDSCVWHQFVVHAADRPRFTAHLDANSVGWDIHYATPPHRQPCYTADSSPSAGVDSCLSPENPPLFRIPEPLTVTDQLADTCVSLPISRCTTPDDARHIAAIINASPAI